MPERHWIDELPQHAGATVAVRGWVVTTRSSGKIAFVVVRDGTGYLQAVLSKKDVAPEVWEALGKLTQETSLEVVGSVRAEARAHFPITPKEHGIAYLFEHRHLWLRSKQQVAIARVRHQVIQAIHDFFYERHFTLVDTPILTGSIGEHAGTLFSVDYFDLGKAYLASIALGPRSAPRSRRPGGI
jgi:asparaginyl-tRNA synthetase